MRNTKKYNEKYRIKTLIIDIYKEILIIFTPKSICSFCNKEATNNLCKKCKVNKVENVYIDYDGIKDNINLGIDINISIYRGFRRHIYLVGGSTLIRKYITSIKYYNKVYIIDSIVNYIRRSRLEKWIGDYDIYIYTPTSFRSYMKRGLNIPKYMTKKIVRKNKSKVIICPFKVIDKVEIKHLNKEEREERVRKKYILKNNGYNFMCLISEMEKQLKLYKEKEDSIKFFTYKILIIDDVYTTGSTLNYLSEILQLELLKRLEKYNLNEDNLKIDYFTLIRE